MPWLLIAAILYAFRELERWLHQHIFKVGWLLTKNYQTTTILYYTFFLPGIVLHEVIYWLVAGILDVRADRAIEWPEAQEIGELQLNFIQLEKDAGRVKVAMISTAPLIAGIVAIYLIANNVLNISAILETASSGSLSDVTTAVSNLTASSDFWLWLYLAFTISNTMMPRFDELRGWWVILGMIISIAVVLLIIGAGSQIFATVSLSVTDALNTLAGILLVMTAINLFVTGVFGTIEATIERITGNSATFKDGKMITMRRSEALALRDQERRQARQARRRAALPAGSASIYRLSLPIPGPPGKEPVSQLASAIVEPEIDAAPSRMRSDDRAGPSIITGERLKPAPLDTPVTGEEPIRIDEPDDSFSSDPEDTPGSVSGITARSSPLSRPTTSPPRYSRTTREEEQEAEEDENSPHRRSAPIPPRSGTLSRQRTLPLRSSGIADEDEEKSADRPGGERKSPDATPRRTSLLPQRDRINQDDTEGDGEDAEDENEDASAVRSRPGRTGRLSHADSSSTPRPGISDRKEEAQIEETATRRPGRMSPRPAALARDRQSTIDDDDGDDQDENNEADSDDLFTRLPSRPEPSRRPGASPLLRGAVDDEVEDESADDEGDRFFRDL